MTSQLTVALQPPYERDKESLESLITRISQQKGSFREITEDELEQEIQNGENDLTQSQDVGTQSTGGAPDQDAKMGFEDVHKAREEMVKQVSQARNESAMALDFVSLLLSKYASAAGQSTMSPYLRQHVVQGSLGGEIMQQPPQPSEADKKNKEMVSMGWRMQSLSGAADSLLASATRLQQEITKETTYWDQVLTVKEGGWAVCRMPREKHILGVRYGFAEAHSDFRDRGFTALRRDEDGKLRLDRTPRSNRSRRLRVRILQSGQPVATSSQTKEVGDEDGPISKQILRARDGIFDEELHIELHREARQLLSHGVRCEGSRVLAPFEGNKQIEVDLLEDGEQSSNQSSQATQSDVASTSGQIPDIMALTLRILLSQAHRRNLHERSQFPAPLRSGSRPRSTYALLKPIIDVLAEEKDVKDLLIMIARGTLGR